MPADTMFVATAKLMAKGQITLPKDVRDFLDLRPGDRLPLICKDGQVVLMNPVRHALDTLCDRMKGKFEEAGLYTDDDVVALCKEVRRDLYNEKYGATATTDAATDADKAATPKADRVAETPPQTLYNADTVRQAAV